MTDVLVDVNVIVASVRRDHVHHRAARAFLEGQLARGHRIVVRVDVLASAMRLLMLPIWESVETSATSAALLAEWVTSVDAVVAPHPEHTWRVLAEISRAMTLTPRTTPDALLAASAIAAGVTLATFDRGFSRYPGLRRELLAG